MSGFESDLDSKVTDTLKETDKKCPRCGGVMNFSPATGGLFCPYCEYKEEIKKKEEEPQTAQELDFAEADRKENCDWGVEKKTILCESCGAESIYDALQIGAVCPFCGSNQVTEASDHRTMSPGGVVPFQITDIQASELFKSWIKRRWFTPKLAKESAKPKSFHGAYLPYWTFDSDTVSEYEARYGKNRIVKNKKGETRTVTDWYPTSGTYREKIDDELVIAATNYNQILLKGLEPFDTGANKAYKPEYVAGYAAQRYAVGLKEAWDRARESIGIKLDSAVRDKISREKNADIVDSLKMKTLYHHVTYKYLLLPVWMSNYKYKEKVYHFMVNGQTGKVSGKAPISPVRVAIAVTAALIACGILYFIFNQS